MNDFQWIKDIRCMYIINGTIYETLYGDINHFYVDYKDDVRITYGTDSGDLFATQEQIDNSIKLSMEDVTEIYRSRGLMY